MASSGNSASNWFSSLASKAENVLNQIDESAATALSVQQNEESGNDGKGHNASNTGFKQQKKPPSRSRQMKRTAGSGQKVISQQLEPFSTEAPLSSSDHIRRMSSNSVDVNTKVTSSSRPSSVSSTKSNKSEGALPLFVDPFSQHSSAVASVSNIGKRINRGETGDGGEQEHSPKSGNEDSFSQVTSNSGSSYLQVDPHNDSITLAYEEDSNIHAEMLSSLSQENKLLKSELQSLSQELHTALNRQREAESRLRRLNEDYDLKCQEANEMFNKWQNVEMDMTEEIKARDSQIAGYRLKLNELSDKVASQNDSIQQLNNEKIRILSDHQASSGLHEESVSHLQTQLNEAQKGFNAQIESERSEKLEFEMKLMKAEENLQALTVELRDASQKLQNERQTSGDYLRQLTMSKQSLEESRTELVEYKSKAVKILQSKEKLISEMKMSFHEGPPLQMEDSVSSGDGSVDGGSGFQSPVSMMSKSQIVTGGTSQFEMMKMELSQYKYETELLREEVTRLTVQLERSRDELAACEATNNQQHMSLTHNLNATHSALQQEKHKVSMLEDELHRNKEELTVTSRELLSVKEKLSRIVAEKDQSISKLQTDLTSLKNKPSSPGNEEFESRVRTLTDTLLSKQSQIERLSSEKQSLNFQLERLSLENSSANGSVRSGSSSTRVNMMTSIFDDDGNKPRGIPAFCRESAFDNQAMKLLKKGLVAIDSFSLTVGVYFRRFALARVFIVIYALLLHLWVTLVILTYKPEMHSDDFQPQIKPIMKAE